MDAPIKFAKLSGSGNDFVCIDNRDGRFDELLADSDGPGRSTSAAGAFAAALCRRGIAVGADGVIFATKPEIEGVSHVAARFFEPDGSETYLCGNGTACFIYWAVANGLVGEGEVKVLTPVGVVRGYPADGDYVRVCIPDPEDMQTDLELAAGGRTWKCDFAVTGVPHVITYVDAIDEVNVARDGKALRDHERFAPLGANANFVQVLGEGQIALRTFEYGIEAETLACGTGSSAAAIMTAQRLDWPKKYLSGEAPISVRANSGDVLKVWFTLNDDRSITDVCVETVVRYVFDAALHNDLAGGLLRRTSAQAAANRQQ